MKLGNFIKMLIENLQEYPDLINSHVIDIQGNILTEVAFNDDGDIILGNKNIFDKLEEEGF